VQEVLAQREFEIGRFYCLRNSYPAAISRLQSVVERYPLFSGADKALYLLGRSYEGQITNIRASKMPEAAKATLIQEFTKNAAAAFSKILTRYPLMARAADAKHRLLALHQPVPTPTQEAIAQNQKEEDSRRSSGMFRHLVDNFSRHPELAQATKVGEPTLGDPKPVSATQVLAAANDISFGGAAKAAADKVSLQTVKYGTPPPNELAPRSDTTAPTTGPATGNAPASTTPAAAVENLLASNDSTPTLPANSRTSDHNQGMGEMKPNVAPDAQTPPPPPQVNEVQQVLQQQGDSSNAANSFSTSPARTDQNAAKENSQCVSSSKEKKKKHKLFF